MVHELFTGSSDDDDGDEWVTDWKTWFESQLGREIAEGEVDDADAVESLADEVASSFATRNRFATNLIAARQHAI
jgi:hypothetical protein